MSINLLVSCATNTMSHHGRIVLPCGSDRLAERVLALDFLVCRISWCSWEQTLVSAVMSSTSFTVAHTILTQLLNGSQISIITTTSL